MASCKECKHYPMCGFSKYVKTAEKCLDFIDASNVVKVVRCKDCIHYDFGVCLKIYSDGAVSQYAWQARNKDDFCSYGERRTNERTD